MAFQGEEIPNNFYNAILVLIPKNTNGEYRGIALLEVIYKLISSIINQRLVNGIKWHDSIHGFRKGRGTSTAIMEAKLRMQLAQRSHKPIYMVFLDLKKAYDTLDRERTMTILKGYGVGNNIQNFILKIWNEDMIVPKQAGFFGKPFRATRGVRQGDIMSPTIFNIVVDAVVNEWLEKDSNKKVEAIFYADDGLLISDDPTAAQEALNIITENFARVGLKMNALKTEAMIIKGGKVYEAISNVAYNRKVTGTGMTHRERSLEKIECNCCGELVGRQYIRKHQQTAKCKANREKYKPEITVELPETIQHEPKCYTINIVAGMENKCTVNNCPAMIKTAGEMRKHFRNRHPEDTIIIADEGLLPQCPKCGLFQKNVDAKHQESLDCKRFSGIKEKREQAKKQALASDFVFTINGTPIKSTTEFKYLGRILNEKDSDQPAIMYNLQRAREKWGRIGRILSKRSANPKVMGTFYKTIVQSVLLYGSETWVVSKQMMKILRSFHRRCSRYIMGKHIWQDSNGEWHQPSSKEVLEGAGLKTVEEYIEQRKITLMHFVKGRPIYHECLSSTPLVSNVNQLVWWTKLENDA
jgi:hypothetical protein